jgi:small GTP-binding protein
MSAQRPRRKVVLLGDSGVGKTSLIQRQFQGTEPPSQIPTIGCHCRDLLFTIDGKPFNLQVMDTAGQEMYRALVPAYLRGAGGVIILYDLTARRSFDSLGHWLAILSEALPSAPVAFIVANKADLEERSAVREEEGMAYAAEHGAVFFKASAATGQGVDEIFQAMAAELARRVLVDAQATKVTLAAARERQCLC